jgi:ribosomal protein L12E/L44/L45/RPP1/RPP2
MNEELTEFLHRNGACSGGIARLDSLGAETLEDAWEKAAPADLVWAVTRPGVMSPEQRRQFLVFVLESIEDKLTDPRSKNILTKLRTKSPITEAAADAAARAADAAARAAAADADAAARAAAREKQAQWIRDNFVLTDLNIN